MVSKQNKAPSKSKAPKSKDVKAKAKAKVPEISDDAMPCEPDDIKD